MKHLETFMYWFELTMLAVVVLFLGIGGLGAICKFWWEVFA